MVFFILPILCIVFEESLFIFFVACYMVHSVCCEDVYRIKRAIGYQIIMRLLCDVRYRSFCLH